VVASARDCGRARGGVSSSEKKQRANGEEMESIARGSVFSSRSCTEVDVMAHHALMSEPHSGQSLASVSHDQFQTLNPTKPKPVVTD
jgi:hypothetical protein